MKDGTGKFICYNVLCATEIARTPGSTIIVHRARNHHPMCCCLFGSTAIWMSRHITTKSVNLARHRCSKGTINPFDTRLGHYWSQRCRAWQRPGYIHNPHVANWPIKHAHLTPLLLNAMPVVCTLASAPASTSIGQPYYSPTQPSTGYKAPTCLENNTYSLVNSQGD